MSMILFTMRVYFFFNNINMASTHCYICGYGSEGLTEFFFAVAQETEEDALIEMFPKLVGLFIQFWETSQLENLLQLMRGQVI